MSETQTQTMTATSGNGKSSVAYVVTKGSDNVTVTARGMVPRVTTLEVARRELRELVSLGWRIA